MYILLKMQIIHWHVGILESKFFTEATGVQLLFAQGWSKCWQSSQSAYIETIRNRIKAPHHKLVGHQQTLFKMWNDFRILKSLFGSRQRMATLNLARTRPSFPARNFRWEPIALRWPVALMIFDAPNLAAPYKSSLDLPSTVGRQGDTLDCNMPSKKNKKK